MTKTILPIFQKLCSRCGETKSSDHFGIVRSHSTGLRGVCKTCFNRKRRIWRNLNLARVRSGKKKSYYSNHERNKERLRANYQLRMYGWKLRTQFGLTLEQYGEILEKQNGKCAICGVKKNRNLCVDHDHKTRQIRGLLCSRCNRGLGMLGDDLEGLRQAVSYLERAGNAEI